ncbi:MAG TPA: hypothetical protein VE127_01480 [Solirubrobacteraceae bacterium]|jgi:hypothetical protein|nr:hypothetical protein [Solirubrobacteraceae bacterium]
MTDRGQVRLRTLAFGDPGGRLWGAAIAAGSAALVAGDAAGHTAAWPLSEESWTAEGSSWRLSGREFDLRVEPSAGAPAAPAEPPADAGLQELCRVHGHIALGGRELRVDNVGSRAVMEGVDAASLASLRAVAGWFGADDAFLLLALRDARARGQESDRVAATLFDPDGRLPVGEPRLSTTYDSDGVPSRVNLELWVGEGDNEFPRRAAGEAAAASGTVTAGGMELRAVPLRCHSRGQEGAGVYVLAGL